MRNDNANGTDPPVILLGGTTNAISIARSLGRRGIQVWAVNEPGSFVGSSRYVNFVPHPERGEPSSFWLSWLTETALPDLDGAVLIPCSDSALEFVIDSRDRLETHFLLPESNDEITLAMLDKARTSELAAEVGTPSPRTWVLSARSDLIEALPEVEYPCALKPCHSHEFQKHYPVEKLFVVHDEAELLERANAMEALGLSMLLTEIIPGGDDQFVSYFTYLDDRGEPLFSFTKHKLRQYPIHFGIGSYHISDWTPDVAEAGLAFFQRIGLRGLAYVEFKRDSRDGRLRLIECNPRFSAATELLVHSGIDTPLLVYNRLTGRSLPAVQSYRRGVRLLRPLEDFAAFREYRRAGELTTLDWVLSVLRSDRTAYFSWLDPWPSVVHLVRQVRYQLAKRVVRPLLNLFGKVRAAEGRR